MANKKPTKPLPQAPDEEQIAHQLEAVHKQIMQDECNGLQLAINASDPVVRIAPLLSLLEDVRRNAVCKTPAVGNYNDLQATGSTAPVVAGKTQVDNPYAIADHFLESGMQIGRFLLHERIGQGGFGIVLRATDTRLNRDVALKILRFEASMSEDACRRFAREAKAAAALSHPNIVHVHESGSDRGIQYLVCEFVQGQNLASLIHGATSYSPEKAAELIAQLADAVEHAHQRGILHRDLKPSNILIEDGTGKPRITDFGMASLIDEIQDNTQTGAAIGTPAYMSPEQAAGAPKEIGPGTDIYGLGSILYQLLTGSPPFSGTTVFDTLRSVLESPATPPRALHSTIPKDLEAICLKCLEKKPMQRYASARGLQTDLCKFSNHEPVLARNTNSFSLFLRWLRRNRLLATSLASAFVFLLTAAIATVVGWNLIRQALVGENVAKQSSQQRTHELNAAIDKYFVLIEKDPTLANVPRVQVFGTELLQHAVSDYETLAFETPPANQLPIERADANYRLGKLAKGLSRNREAEEYFTAALSAINEHLNSHPDDLERYPTKLELLSRLAACKVETHDIAGARELWLAILTASQEQFDRAPTNLSSKSFLARQRANYVTFLLEHDIPLNDALPLLLEAQELCTQIIESQPANVEFQLLSAMLLDLRSQLTVKTDGYFPALKLLDQAVGIMQSLQAGGQTDPKIAYHACTIFRHRAESRQQIDMHEAALADCQTALALAPPSMKLDATLQLALAFQQTHGVDSAASLVSEISREKSSISECELLLRYNAWKWSNGTAQTRGAAIADAKSVMSRLHELGYFNVSTRFESLLDHRDILGCATEESTFASELREMLKSISSLCS